MQGTILPNQSYVDNGVAHIFIALVEGQDNGVDITRNVEVAIPVTDFAGKTLGQRRALVVAAVQAVEGRAPRTAFPADTGTVTV